MTSPDHRFSQETPSAESLPVGFADLAGFVPEWSLDCEEARFRKLHSVSMNDLQTFYDAMLPRLPTILLFLRNCRLGAMSAEQKALFHLAMTFVETSHPIDLGWADTDFPGAYRWQAFEFRSVSRVSRA